MLRDRVRGSEEQWETQRILVKLSHANGAVPEGKLFGEGSGRLKKLFDRHDANVV